MICPHCSSSFTRIEPNDNHYTCHACHRTFGYITGTGLTCPRCGSDNVLAEADQIRCMSDDCRFTSCVGYEKLDPELLTYTQVEGCGKRFQYHNGVPVLCSNCNPAVSDTPPGVVGCAYTATPDKELCFPQSVMYPLRDKNEFFQQQVYDVT